MKRRQERWNKRDIPTPTDLAYIAGFFDGEGSVIIKQMDSKRPMSLILNCQLVNTRREPLDFANRFYPGSLYLGKRNPGDTKRKNIFRLQLICETAFLFLKDVLPYLQIKKSQAELGIHFHSVRKAETLRRKNRKSIPPKQVRFRQDCRDKMAALNKRGPDENGKIEN